MKRAQIIKYNNGDFRIILFSPLIKTLVEEYKKGQDYTIPPIEIDIIDEKDIDKK